MKSFPPIGSIPVFAVFPACDTFAKKKSTDDNKRMKSEVEIRNRNEKIDKEK